MNRPRWMKWILAFLGGMDRPAWIPKWLWGPVTWVAHGGIQWVFYEIDPGFGWGFLPAWYYRDRYKDHRGNPPERWPLDGIMDVLTPIVVQVVLYWRGL